jgi:dynein heavy chain
MFAPVAHTSLRCRGWCQVEDFKPHIPLISALRNPGMRERHWKELSSQIGIDIVLNDSFTLTKVFSLGLGSHIEVRVPA